MQWRMKNTWEPDCEIGLDNILILRLTGESWLTIQQSGLAEYKFGLNNPWLRYWPSFCLSSKSPISILPTIILTVSWEVLANIFSTGCLLTCRTIWQYDSKQMWCHRASYSACVPTWPLHQHPVLTSLSMATMDTTATAPSHPHKQLHKNQLTNLLTNVTNQKNTHQCYLFRGIPEEFIINFLPCTL